MKMKDEFRKQLASYVMASFGLVAGLAWNDAVKSTIEYLFPANNGGWLIVKFVSALVFTTLVVVVSVFLNREKNN